MKHWQLCVCAVKHTPAHTHIQCFSASTLLNTTELALVISLCTSGQIHFGSANFILGMLSIYAARSKHSNESPSRAVAELDENECYFFS